MNFHHKSAIRALVFLLLVGPIQIQNVFACVMMEGVFLDECCCEDSSHSDNIDDDITYENLCCAESIQLSFNDDSYNSVDVIKPIEVRSDVDPPLDIFTSYEYLVKPIYGIENSHYYLSHAIHQGSKAYLVTQRFRI